MYDTSPLSPFKGDIKALFSSESDTKALESLFELNPAHENSFDLTEFVSSEVDDTLGAYRPPVPDSSAGATPATTAEDLLTLSSAVTSQHLAELERQLTTTVTVASGSVANSASLPTSGIGVSTAPSSLSFLQQVPTTVSQVVGCHQPALSPSLTVDEVSQAFSDDSCVFMPEYEPLRAASAQGDTWGLQQTTTPPPFYSTVKTEDLTLSSLTACTLEASLPGFTTTSTSPSSSIMNVRCKAEPDFEDEEEEAMVSPSRSERSLSESSSATVSDSSRRRSSSTKGGSRRRQVPKGTEEYKEKRARNNIAVRKSRAKAKEKQRNTESRVKELVDRNDCLQKKVEMLTKELTVLKGLFINVGASLPDDFTKLMEQS